MESFLDPDARRQIFLGEVVSLIRKERVRKVLARRVVGMAWNLAECEIKLKDGEDSQKVRVESLTSKLESTDLGKGILKLKDQMVEAIQSNREETRRGLAEYLTKRI